MRLLCQIIQDYISAIPVDGVGDDIIFCFPRPGFLNDFLLVWITSKIIFKKEERFGGVPKHWPTGCPLRKNHFCTTFRCCFTRLGSCSLLVTTTNLSQCVAIYTFLACLNSLWLCLQFTLQTWQPSCHRNTQRQTLQ